MKQNYIFTSTACFSKLFIAKDKFFTKKDSICLCFVVQQYSKKAAVLRTLEQRL
jgi:hypothetical protein